MTSSNHTLTDMGITVGRDGLAILCHNTGGTIVTHCDDAACTTRTNTTIGGGGNCSITIGADGLPVVAYGSGGMNVALCQDSACTSFTTQQLDSSASSNSIAIGIDGNPIVAYRNDSENAVKVAQCQSADCGTATVSTISTNTNIGLRGVALAIGIDGLPILTYFDYTDQELDVAHCDSTDCSTSTITNYSTPDTSGTTAGNNADITLGADGLAIISRFDDDANRVEVWHCDDITCSSVTTTANATSAGRFNSIAIGADGKAIVAYRRFSANDLYLARCSDEACTSMTEFAIDSPDNVGTYTAIAVSPGGIVHAIYRDTTNSRVKLARVPLGRGVLAR